MFISEQTLWHCLQLNPEFLVAAEEIYELPEFIDCLIWDSFAMYCSC